jgi:hypothetical protein
MVPDVSSNGLEQPVPMALLAAAHMASQLQWLHLLLVAFLG